MQIAGAGSIAALYVLVASIFVPRQYNYVYVPYLYICMHMATLNQVTHLQIKVAKNYKLYTFL